MAREGYLTFDGTNSRTEATVTTRRRFLPPSLPLFVGLCALVIAIKLLFAFYPGDFPIKQQAEAFGWPMIAMLIAIGLAGLFADHSLGLPEPLTDRRREWRGVIWSVLTGFAYGVVTVIIDVVRHPRNVLRTRAAWDHVAWPWSVPFYLSARSSSNSCFDWARCASSSGSSTSLCSAAGGAPWCFGSSPRWSRCMRSCRSSNATSRRSWDSSGFVVPPAALPQQRVRGLAPVALRLANANCVPRRVLFGVARSLRRSRASNCVASSGCSSSARSIEPARTLTKSCPNQPQ